jgi:WD40 repeat protein
VRYLPDGKRIIAGDYPGGVVQVWDAETGKQLTRIETGYGYRGSDDYISISPDGKTLFVDSRTRRKATRFEKDGKKGIRWDCAGEVRAWDIASGKLCRTFQHTPPRGINFLALSPDGSTFVTTEDLSGESSGRPKRSSSLWDVKTGHCQELPEGLSSLVVFSPDSRTFAGQVLNEDVFENGIKLFDVATAREKLSIPFREKDARRIGFRDFSPDGKLLIGQLRDEVKTGQHWLKFWDAATGQELASFTGEKKDYFLWMTISPDSRMLAVTNLARVGPSTLFLFDLPTRKLTQTIVLGEKGSMRQPVFSPDGKWIAVTTQMFPDDVRGRDPEPEDVAQPRIHLIEVAAAAVRETLIAPPGFTGSACFSPDGKTLATDGHGKVLLWDLTRPPGQPGP